MTSEHETKLSVYRAIHFHHMLQQMGEKPTSIIDVGCSTGIAIEKMGELFDDVEFAGLDITISNECASRIQALDGLAYEVNFNNLQNEAIPTYDWVFCSHTLEHAYWVKNLAHSLTRIAGRGIFLVVPLESEAKFQSYKNTFTKEQLEGPGMHHYHSTDPTDWLNLFQGTGFVPVYMTLQREHSDMVAVLMRQSLLSYGGHV